MYSRDSYRDLLVQALEQGYQFISFFDELPTDGKYIYLRHDVDASPEMALEMAEINQSLGIRATFFLLLDSQIYSVITSQTLRTAHAIHDASQDLGFHYALPLTPLKMDALPAHIWEDFKLVQQRLPEIKPIFSWHNTTPDILEWGLHHEVPGLLNAYSPEFFKDIPYYSDSLARYTPAEFGDILRRNHPVMQLLFHPEIWIGGGENLREISAQVWAAIIRACDYDPDGTNPALSRLIPNRIPDAILEKIKELIMHQENVK